jgi:hypothetical protein
MHFFPRYRGDAFEGKAIDARIVSSPAYAPGEFLEMRDQVVKALAANVA